VIIINYIPKLLRQRFSRRSVSAVISSRTVGTEPSLRAASHLLRLPLPSPPPLAYSTSTRHRRSFCSRGWSGWRRGSERWLGLKVERGADGGFALVGNNRLARPSALSSSSVPSSTSTSTTRRSVRRSASDVRPRPTVTSTSPLSLRSTSS
jgi:hypothetical protein